MGARTMLALVALAAGALAPAGATHAQGHDSPHDRRDDRRTERGDDGDHDNDHEKDHDRHHHKGHHKDHHGEHRKDHHGKRAARHAAKVVRGATRQYRDVADAEADGYGQFMTCVREPGLGAMGTHWVNGELVGDTILDPRHPEAIMYETKPNGRLKLLGVEYLVFQDAWDAEHADPPELFGQEFHVTTTPNRYGLPAFYALHVWAWKRNPDGTFANWNPTVSCDHAAGDPI